MQLSDILWFLLSCCNSFIFNFLKSWTVKLRRYGPVEKGHSFIIFLLLSSHYFLRGHIYNQVIVSVNKYIGFATCQYCLKCILCFSSFNSNNSSEIGILIISLLQITLNTERLSNMLNVIQLLSGRFRVQIQSF